ncbi:hypothetical protein R1sor_016259 [Riccia sorocarpa]|uniref:PSP proline-rich domain-containing protein n=1 Tax=Riccia sorocarpa TaxID=122646 RepID=A0ABD3HI01_9MARC
MGDDEIEAKKLLEKLKELEREEGEIEFLEQQRRNSQDREIEEGEINDEEGEIYGEGAGGLNDDYEAQEQKEIATPVEVAAGVRESNAGSREDIEPKAVLSHDRSNFEREEEEEEAAAAAVQEGDFQVQTFDCFIGDENGVSSDMEIEEDIPSPHLKGIHVSTNFRKVVNPPVLSATKSQSLDEQNVNNSGDSTLKRKRVPDLGYNPAVQVSYEGLTRESKKKLQEALHQWAQWHTRRYPTGLGAVTEPLESGTDVFSPALSLEDVGNGGVSVWMDRPTKHARNNEVEGLQVSGTKDRAAEVPLYDRAFASALTSDDLSDRSDRSIAIEKEGARCFNCGGYTHSLAGCPRPRDMNAISTARKMYMEKKGLRNGDRTPLRYYQASPGGQFDDIKPGELGSQVRQVLGIGEHDPPPWFHRMRDLGYPPGYLEEAEEESSEVEIFGGVGDEGGVLNGKEQNEEGEIVDKKGTGDEHSVPMKMTVQFPGINAPIPEKADKRLWTSPVDSSNTQAQRVMQKGSQQQSSLGEGAEIRPVQHSFSWAVSSSDPSPRDESKPVGNSHHLFQWRPGPAPVLGIMNSPLDGWKRRDGEASSGIRSSGRETVQPLPDLVSDVIRPPGVGDILSTLPTPHIYSRQYHPQPPSLSMPTPKNSNEAWLKAQAALGVLQSDQRSGTPTPQQQWSRR